MAYDGVTDGDETANDEPPKGKQFEGIDYLNPPAKLPPRDPAAEAAAP